MSLYTPCKRIHTLFLPVPSLSPPLSKSVHISTIKTNSTPCMTHSSTTVSRRTILQTALLSLPSLFLLPYPTAARRKPSKPLTASLLPLVRVHDALSDLATDVETGTNGDVRRITKTLLKGSNVPNAAKEASLWLPQSQADQVILHGKEAFEYLNQVIEYFDSTATKKRPPAEQLNFCLKAIQSAKEELDIVLDSFDKNDIDSARQSLGAAV